MTTAWLSPPLLACHQESHLPRRPEAGEPHKEWSRARTGPFVLRDTYREVCVRVNVLPPPIPPSWVSHVPALPNSACLSTQS